MGLQTREGTGGELPAEQVHPDLGLDHAWGGGWESRSRNIGGWH